MLQAHGKVVFIISGIIFFYLSNTRIVASSSLVTAILLYCLELATEVKTEVWRRTEGWRKDWSPGELRSGRGLRSSGRAGCKESRASAGAT